MTIVVVGKFKTLLKQALNYVDTDGFINELT